MLRLRHPKVALAAVLSLASLTACGQSVKTYAIPPSTYHSAQTFGGLAYAQQSAAEQLDLSLPAGNGTVPLVILVHGGYFGTGDKGQQEVNAARKLVDAGYAVATVNYRLGGESRFPAAVQDVKAAVRWLRAHAATYYINPEKFAIWGQDAGGYLAAAIGVTGDEQTIFDSTVLGDNGVSAAVQGVITWVAPFDFKTLDANAKAAGCSDLYQHNADAGSVYATWLGGPLAKVTAEATEANLLAYVPTATTLPNFLIVQGSGDCTVPPAQAKSLDKALRKAGGKSTLDIVKVKNAKTLNKTQIKPALAFLAALFQV